MAAVEVRPGARPLATSAFLQESLEGMAREAVHHESVPPSAFASASPPGHLLPPAPPPPGRSGLSPDRVLPPPGQELDPWTMGRKLLCPESPRH